MIDHNYHNYLELGYRKGLVFVGVIELVDTIDTHGMRGNMTNHFRYLKWRNPHRDFFAVWIRLMDTGVSPPPKTAENKVQETLHFRYPKRNVW